MEPSAREFFQQLLATPSPSGFEQPVQALVRDYVGSFADQVRTDVHGNVIAAVNPEAPLRLMLAGHCDQIGMLVSYIDEQGFIYAQTIGGWDPQQLIGQRMTIWAESGPVPAVIARKPIHLLDDQQRKTVVRHDELWLDIGASDQQDAAALVCVGDPITLELGMVPLRNGLATAPAMDNTAGLWVVIEALRRAASAELECGLFAVSTVQEEIGLRGARTSAYGIDPQLGIAVDVTHATDCPTIDKKMLGSVQLGGGPVIFRGPNMNPGVVTRLLDVCRQDEIDFQLAAAGRATPNDANTLQITRAGVATGLVSVPNRYMHSAVETICLDDMDRAADLLAGFARSIRADDDFTPG